MSMTQVAFLRKADILTKNEIEEVVQGLGHDFKILDEIDTIYSQDGLSCSINGHKTFFTTYFNQPTEITNDCEWIKADMTNQDTAISFVWGADFAAGACIGLISIALIDKCQALIYYLDDDMKYTREMLLEDIPQFLHELEKQDKNVLNNQSESKVSQVKSERKKSFWDKIKDIFK